MQSVDDSVTCIVPFYNEGKRLNGVVNFLKNIKLISKIILVDDGSTDKFVFHSNSKTSIINLPKNFGKASAIQAGFQVASSTAILLFDADLSNCNHQELEAAIEIFLQNKKIDMLILKRLNDPWINRLIRTNIVISGQRLLRSRDLHQIFQKKINKFQFELAVNDYMINQNKKYYWTPFFCRDVYKIEKMGFIKGVWSELKMYWDLCSYKNPLWYFAHLVTFCKTPASEIIRKHFT